MAHHKGAKGGRGHLSTSKPCTINRNYYFKAYMNGNRKKKQSINFNTYTLVLFIFATIIFFITHLTPRFKNAS